MISEGIRTAPVKTFLDFVVHVPVSWVSTWAVTSKARVAPPNNSGLKEKSIRSMV